MSSRQPITGELFASRVAVLQSLYDGDIDLRAAAEALAFITRSVEDLDAGVGLTWFEIISSARDEPQQHQELAALMGCLSRLADDEGDPAAGDIVEGGNAWSILYTFGMELNVSIKIHGS